MSNIGLSGGTLAKSYRPTQEAKQGTPSAPGSDKYRYSGLFRFGAGIRVLIPASFRGGGVVVNHEQLSHLHASYRAYALLSASERIQWIRQDRWIHYSRAA
jgi:hypothetical protein